MAFELTKGWGSARDCVLGKKSARLDGVDAYRTARVVKEFMVEPEADGP
jgi:hypothetical protein